MPPSPRAIFVSKRHPRLRAPAGEVAQLVHLLDENRARFDGGCPDGELSIAFLTDAGIAKIHADFMDDPTATDVITFEGDPTTGLAGEICISADTAKRYADEHGHDFATELALYLVHGWLHLAGYDDLEPKKKTRMRAAEKRAMTILARQNAIPEFRCR